MTAFARIPKVEPKLFDVDIEQALIGACLTDVRAQAEAIDLCAPEDFSDQLHQRLWSAIAVMRAQGRTVTPLTVGAWLSTDEGLFEVRGRGYLSSLAMSAPAGANVKDFARIITDLALRRRLDAQLEKARTDILDQGLPVTECLGPVIEIGAVASDRAAAKDGYMPTGDALDELLRQTEAQLNGQTVDAVKTGVDRLDEITGGFQAADLVVIAGRPGAGKSVLLTTVARVAAQAGRPAIMFELEMPRRAILQRLICDVDYDTRTKAAMAYTRFRNGKLWNGEFERAYAASQVIRGLPLEIFDTSGMTIHQIATHAERFVSRARTMGVIVIDYLQIVTAGDRYQGSKVNEVTEISNSCKRLAKRTGWPVVVGCQLNREVEKRDASNRRPQLSDLRESGAIEQDADIVIGMHRPAYYVMQKRPAAGKSAPEYRDWANDFNSVRNDLELSALKNRNGPPGIVDCFVDIGASAIRNKPGQQPGQDDGEGLLV